MIKSWPLKLSYLLSLLGCFIVLNPAYVQANNSVSNYNELLYDVVINGQDLNSTTLFLQNAQGQLLAKQEDLTQWRLILPVAPPLKYENAEWYKLADFTDLTYQVDSAKLVLKLTVPAKLFKASEFAIREAPLEPMQPVTPGGYLNYTLYGNNSLGQTTINGYFELIGFSNYGVLSQSVLGNNDSVTHQTKFVRLNSNWTLDYPKTMHSLRLGDNISLPGSWGQAVKFGGIQWATNFMTNPYFKTAPFTSVQGEAVAPSTINIFVNNALVSRREVLPGPFSIREIPIVTGQGDVRVVTTDILGRQRITVLPYYTNSNLLRKGVVQDDYEIGAIRNNYGGNNNDYGRLMAVAMNRKGFSDSFTGEWRAEAVGNQQTIGLGAIATVFNQANITANTAISHSPKGEGCLLGTGIQRQTNQLTLGANIQYASQHFTQLGLQPKQLPPRIQSQTFIGFPNVWRGSVGFSYTAQSYYDQAHTHIVTVSYSRTLFQDWFMGLSALANLSGSRDKTVFLSISYALGDKTSVGANTDLISHDKRTSIQLNRSLPAGTGYGYNLQATTGNNPGQQATLNYQNAIGSYSIQTAHQNSVMGYQGSASGSIAFLGGHTYLSRAIYNSFGVVEVANLPNVKVYNDNQLIGKTSKSGNLLIPNLRAYQKNNLRIASDDLPMDTQLTSDKLVIIPYLRSGVLAKFKIKRSHSAIVHLIDETGQPLPAGINAVNQAKQAFPIGFNGELFATDLEDVTAFTVVWQDNRCHFTINYLKTTDPIPDLGTLICHR